MSAPNPYAPPNAPVSDAVAAAQGKVPQYVIAALIAVQLVGTFYFADVYLELVRRGAVHSFALLFGFPGSLCLYVGAILAAITGVRGRVLFLLGAVGLAAAVWYWGGPYPWTVVAAFGAVLGVAGWWITRRARNARIAGANASS